MQPARASARGCGCKMKVVEVQPDDTLLLQAAAGIHSAAWQDSHRAFCSEAFVAAHTPERQLGYLASEMAQGKRLWLLSDEHPIGLVTVHDNLIENLYVHPSDQRMGYGTLLLRHAMAQCAGAPSLWVLDNNRDAIRLYERHGFRFTGHTKKLTETLAELEMHHIFMKG